MADRSFPLSLLATGIGSVPHVDPHDAAHAVARLLPDLPAWPQLYHRSPLERMAAQFMHGVTNARIEGDQVVFDGQPGEHDMPELTEERAAGFFALLEEDLSGVKGLKGHATGPLTLGYLATQADGAPAFEDLRIVRRLAQLMGRVAAFQEDRFRRITRHHIIFFDEPYLNQALEDRHFGRSVVLDILSSVCVWLRGMKGLHVCSPPPWDFLTSLPYDVISVDAYHYGESTELAVGPIREFLSRGGAIAWGVVPASGDELGKETAESLVALVTRTWGRLQDLGIAGPLLARQSLITPACGLANLTPAEAERAMALAQQVAVTLRARGEGAAP